MITRLSREKIFDPIPAIPVPNAIVSSLFPSGLSSLERSDRGIDLLS